MDIFDPFVWNREAIMKRRPYLVIIFITLLLSTGCGKHIPNEPIPIGIPITIHISGLYDNDEASITAKSISTNIGSKSGKNGDIPFHVVGESEDFVLSATAKGYDVFPDQYQIKYIGKDIYITNEDGTVLNNPTIYFIFSPIPTPSAKPAATPTSTP
jgi:hypothetical protein